MPFQYGNTKSKNKEKVHGGCPDDNASHLICRETKKEMSTGLSVLVKNIQFPINLTSQNIRRIN